MLQCFNPSATISVFDMWAHVIISRNQSKADYAHKVLGLFHRTFPNLPGHHAQHPKCIPGDNCSTSDWVQSHDLPFPGRNCRVTGKSMPEPMAKMPQMPQLQKVCTFFSQDSESHNTNRLRQPEIPPNLNPVSCLHMF